MKNNICIQPMLFDVKCKLIDIHCSTPKYIIYKYLYPFAKVTTYTVVNFPQELLMLVFLLYSLPHIFKTFSTVVITIIIYAYSYN